MSGQNEVSQVVRLNSTQYRADLTRVQSETRTNLQKMMKAFTEAGGSYQDFTNLVKKQTGSMIGSIEEAGKSFAKNLSRGAIAGTALAGIDALRSGMRAAVSTGMAFDEALARVASRADLSAKQVAKLKQEFFELGKTGAKLETIPAAFDAIYGATGNVDQSRSVMEPIAKAAAMSGGDAGDVAQFVKDRLKGEGQEINRGNVEGLLQSLVSAQRGGEFNSLQEAMAGFGKIDAVTQRKAGISDRGLAGLLAGATRSGTDRETALSGLQGLMQLSTGGLHSDAALAGILGVKGGSFMRGGKFDLNALLNAPGLSNRSFNEADKSRLIQGGGLSDSQANGVLALLRSAERVKQGMQKVASDTKTLDQAFQETTDTLSHRLIQLKNTVVHGFSDVFSPLMVPAKAAAGGHPGAALMGLPGALGGMLSGAASHPLLASGGLLATAAGGALLKKLGLGGGIAGLGAGVAKGKALQAGAGVTPVYVVNFGEMGNSGPSGLPSGVRDLVMGTGGAAGGAMSGSIMKLMRMAGGAAAGAESLIGMPGMAGLASLLGIGAGKAAEYVGTGALEKDVGGLFGKNPAPYSGSIPLPADTPPQKVQLAIEVHSKDPAYMAIPKATDNPRDARGL
jgi:hypothetical protein